MFREAKSLSKGGKYDVALNKFLELLMLFGLGVREDL